MPGFDLLLGSLMQPIVLAFVLGLVAGPPVYLAALFAALIYCVYTTNNIFYTQLHDYL